MNYCQKWSGMQINKPKQKEMVDHRSSGVLPNQKVNVSLSEDEIWTAIDTCNAVLGVVDSFAPGITENHEPIYELRNKLFEAHETLWEMKELKTRKNSILEHQKIQNSKPNPTLMNGEW